MPEEDAGVLSVGTARVKRIRESVMRCKVSFVATGRPHFVAAPKAQVSLDAAPRMAMAEAQVVPEQARAGDYHVYEYDDGVRLISNQTTRLRQPNLLDCPTRLQSNARAR